MAQDVAEKKPAPMETFRAQLEQRLDSFVKSLPPGISAGQFQGVVTRAVMANPTLLSADRVSFFESILAAANDGLLPDGREGAFVIYRAKNREGKKEDSRDEYINKVQWMPMIAGVLKKLNNTGQVLSYSVEVVYAGDHFRHWVDDQGPHIEFERARDDQRDLKVVVVGVFAQIRTTNGGIFTEFMSAAEIDAVRKRSRAKDNGPWVDWWSEMARKTVLRRLIKKLPVSREVMVTLERDDVLYDLDRERAPAALAGRTPMPSLPHRLDALAGQMNVSPADKEPVGRGDDEQQQSTKSASAARRQGADERSSSFSEPAKEDGALASGSAATSEPDAELLTPEQAYQAGRRARTEGKLSRKAVPAQFRGKLLDDYLAGFDAPVEGEREPGEEG